MTAQTTRLLTLTSLLTVATIALTAAPAQADTLSYVALGDSYSSGVGTGTYIPDSGSCYRSTYAYPYQVAEERGYDLDFAACSGAETGDVWANQLAALDDGTDYVTISIGGNDAGFADILTACTLPGDCSDDIEAAEEFVATELPGLLDDLYAEITALAPDAEVVVVGYPRLFTVNGILCVPLIDRSERILLNAGADLLADVIAERAEAHGFAYADAIPPYAGHGVCALTPWINDLNLLSQRESYHPNRRGQNAYTSLVLGLL